MTVRRVAGGSDRITFTFTDSAIRNTWLRVTLLANPRTGLAAPDVLYFGTLAGDTGGGGTPVVNTLDLARVRTNIGSATAAAKARYDFNRDGAINARDVLIARANQGRTLPLVTAPPAGPAGNAVQHSPGTTLRRPSRRGAWAEQIDAGAAT